MEKNVPVGIIDSTVGGTTAEAWLPAEALVGVKGYSKDAKEFMNNQKIWHQKLLTVKKNWIETNS